MLEQILQFGILFLAVYGFISLMGGAYGLLDQRINPEKYKTRVVILVKDQEETIEGIIRTVFIERFLRKLLSKDGLTVIDMGSKDNTLKILHRLKDEYGNMVVLSHKEGA